MCARAVCVGVGVCVGVCVCVHACMFVYLVQRKNPENEARQVIVFARSKSDAIAKADGTYQVFLTLPQSHFTPPCHALSHALCHALSPTLNFFF